MISIFSFQPELFNNNGDQGNIEVLTAELTKCGEEFKFVESFSTADFALIGDASRAVMKHFALELEGLRPAILKRFQSGQATLLVGSAYEFFASDLGLGCNQIARRSEFVNGDYFGYRNTDRDLPAVTRNGAFFATSLFGPFLAKNPQVLIQVLSSLGVVAELDSEKLNWIQKIREFSAG